MLISSKIDDSSIGLWKKKFLQIGMEGIRRGISREAGSVSRIKRLARFVAGRRGAKCFLPPKLFAEASSPTSPSTIRYTEAHLCSTFLSLFLSPSVVKRNFNHILRDWSDDKNGFRGLARLRAPEGGTGFSLSGWTVSRNVIVARHHFSLPANLSSDFSR